MSQRVEPKDYPLWVRVCIRSVDPRSDYVRDVCSFVGLATAMFTVFWVSRCAPAHWDFRPGDDDVLAVFGSGFMLSALWQWRAIRWVDQYGTWADKRYPDEDDSDAGEPE